ncbi:hypothetical protein [Burkholderia lata]|uniref:hypothetical protein n=1 Tax=Burkholderia lata (strain ATCC 17760 / DSM 23089 / LMG 22485 / NCIMB 9086 / R18194 / 383) TaxID=482957 RepID=UPI0015839636|nr:hypothetical protein [Burkholderia lata]
MNYRSPRMSLGFIGAFIFLSGKMAHAEEITLCQPHEEIYISCPVGGKLVSLCASGNISPNNGYVQYRYGLPERVELQFPKNPNPPGKEMTISDISAGNLNFIHIKFRTGVYDYVIYQGSPSGVYVKKHGRLVSNHMCAQGMYQQLNQRIFRGLRTASPVSGVDD